MKNITLLRHGQTAYNAEKRITAHHDIDLNETGLEQAEEVACLFNDQSIVFDYIYSSDLKRAHETAKIATKHQTIKHFETNLLLRELDAGIYTGRLKSEIDHLPEYQEIMNANDLRRPEGESFMDLVERAKKFKAEYINKIEQGNILIASHSVTTKALLVAFGQETPESVHKKQIPNAKPISFNYS